MYSLSKRQEIVMMAVNDDHPAFHAIGEWGGAGYPIWWFSHASVCAVSVCQEYDGFCLV